ncbi:MAG TPA: hypothetical protein DEB06_00695 [Phycisphaerales bacterium]|nr:hypothetical protein [Phycisphaerales bacterium]
MRNPFRTSAWPPYAVGAAIGVLSWITFGLMDKALGTSTSIVNAAGVIVGAVAPEHVKANAYLAKHVVKSPPFDWQTALDLALVAGAALAGWLAIKPGERSRVEHVPSEWAARFGPSRGLRYAGAFVGGLILIFGARLAGGCTSGHGISGGLQLALSSWTFIVALFGAGIASAFLIYRTGRRAPVVGASGGL